MINYYRLPKKQLSVFSKIEKPIIGTYDGRRLSRPVVLEYSLATGEVLNVFTLSCFKHRFSLGTIDVNVYRYEIYSLY